MGKDPVQCDVLIVGGGPAGMTAAMWCAELGISAYLVDQNNVLGGQLGTIHNPIQNYPGAAFSNGEECLKAFIRSLGTKRFDIGHQLEVSELRPASRTAVLSSGQLVIWRALVIATGVRRRELNVPGETEFRGKGVLNSGSKERDVTAGKRVAVIGGGDAALENALILSAAATKVYLIHRGVGFSARKEFVDAVLADSLIEVIFNSTVALFGGDGSLGFAELRSRDGGERTVEIDNVVIRIGVVPNTEFAANGIDTDKKGFVRVDAECRTSIPGIYAVGDVANPVSPTIATAVGTGATAAKSIAKYLRKIE